MRFAGEAGGERRDARLAAHPDMPMRPRMSLPVNCLGAEAVPVAAFRRAGRCPFVLAGGASHV
jgi:hypothetical protein